MGKQVEPSQLDCVFDGFRKRSGLVVPFRTNKIAKAIKHAVEAAAREHGLTLDKTLPEKVTEEVLDQLDAASSEYYVYSDEKGLRVPSIEDVQDLVEIVLAESGETMIVASYKRYRKRRELARRNIRVRGESRDQADVTDASLLLVESTTSDMTLPWDRKRIVTQILDKTELSPEVATSVAKSVENHIISAGFETINTTLIRELVNNELTERGHREQLRLRLTSSAKTFAAS